ncbi:MAG TPA: DedA family protein, partial [Bacilli bacterium]|nr:DedA family protein [Bacilli bacterium]
TAFLGSMTGITISYSMGRRFGLPLIDRYGKRFGITERRLGVVNGWYNRFGKFVLIVGYFIPGIRHVTAFAAGMSKMHFGSFALFAYLGGIIWSLTFITLGKSLGVHWTKVSDLSHRYLFWAVLVIVVAVVGYGLWFWYKRKKQNN